jgi:hypothetical protein
VAVEVSLVCESTAVAIEHCPWESAAQLAGRRSPTLCGPVEGVAVGGGSWVRRIEPEDL